MGVRKRTLSAHTGLRRLSERFIRARSGATAVEFGMVGLPFLALMGASIENGLVYWQQEILQQAVIEAGRLIYTGSFQTANAATTDTTTLMNNFRAKICATSTGSARVTIFNCNNVRISVTKASSISDFSTASLVSPVTINTNGISDWNPSFPSYTCGGASAIMIVQAAVDVAVLIPLLNSSVANLPNRRRVIQAATVFKIEPFTTPSGCS